MRNIFKNKTVLITGGTGFLGRHLTREILKQEPKSIRLFSRDELKHHKCEQIFKNNKKIRNFIGDVRDYERLEKALIGCDIVIHAAALKRLDMIEYNVEESIKTNILGTLNVIRAALKNDVENVIMVSTDKACSPINTYGAGKFVSERIFINSNFNKGSARTIFSCVRYGNVINSSGSLIPIVMSKIRSNESILLTNKEMTRFFITPKQAVDLIFQAIDDSIGGEIFVPKLPSFNISDLIEVLVEEFGKGNKIEVTGLRPGEKIHELMINSDEADRTYDLGNHLVISSQIEKYRPKILEKYKSRLKRSYLGKPKVKFEEYSSKENNLGKEQIREYLKTINLEEYNSDNAMIFKEDLKNLG